MAKLCFCDYCGTQLNSRTDNRISMVNRTTKKEETILHLCGVDVKAVTNMRFTPIRSTRSKIPQTWYNIKRYNNGHSMSLYTVPAPQAEQLQHLRRASVLGTGYYLKDGRRYYTKELVAQRLLYSNHKDENLVKCLQILYKKQTDDEREAYKTIHHNRSGFNQADAKFLSAMARITLDKKTELSQAQKDTARRMIMKYCEQIANILNTEEPLE